MTRKKEEPDKKKTISTPRKTVTRKKIEPDGAPPSLQEEKAVVARSETKPGFPVVGIGASAGGLEAFEQFFANMPPDSNMGFVLVPHLDPTHKSMMPELIQRTSKMPVVQAEDGTAVEPNNVYIIPPNRDMSILRGKLVLLEPSAARGLRHPIDFFFRALAQDKGENAVCIILSGTGTEGTLGLKAVKGEGGLVLAQDPKEAKYDGMPSSAIATGLVDDVLPASKLPERLLGYVKQSLKRQPSLEERPSGRVDMQQQQQRIFSLIRAHTGHDFSLYKQNTILRRIQRRMALHQIDDLADYVTYLQNNKHEIDILFKEFLIRVTNFFRDEAAFKALKEKVVPVIARNKSYENPVRVWVPGCSTGEEAYSLAIILHEYAEQTKNHFKVQIFATDIDSSAIEIARAGTYTDNISVDVSPERLNRYFTREGNTYKIKEELREMTVFSIQNVIKDAPFSKLDLISCRNLLIYLGPQIQKKVLPLFHYGLNPGGMLFLGSSENIGDSIDMFKTVNSKWKIFQAVKVQTLPPAIVGLRHIDQLGRGVKPDGLPAAKEPQALKIHELTEKLLLERYSPPCAIVNERGDILYIKGRTGKYLEPASGRASMNIIEMAREGLRLDLRTALRKAVKEKKSIRYEQVQVKTDGGVETINLDANYIAAPDHLQGLIMVVFNPVPRRKDEKFAPAKDRAEKKSEARMLELEYELKSTKENLQSAIEELESSNEELMSTNEELQSSNEELQSTNEELETSREELQSMNEELMIVNSELEGKIGALNQANNDMRNLVSSTRIATIFLDNNLRIKSFTPDVVALFSLIETDIQRPINDIASKLDYPEFLADVKEVMRTSELKERTVRHPEDRWYLARVLPYRVKNNTIDGAVITFVDITAQRLAAELQAALTYTRGIIEAVREPFLVLDSALKVISANKSFFETFRVSHADTEGRLIYDIGNRQWDIPKLRELLEKILPESTELKALR